MQLEIEKLRNENIKLAAEARKTGVEAYVAETGLEFQQEQEALENAKMGSEVQKNQAQAAKLARDANEPYRKDTGGQK
jgi:heat shock protein HspQ